MVGVRLIASGARLRRGLGLALRLLPGLSHRLPPPPLALRLGLATAVVRLPPEGALGLGPRHLLGLALLSQRGLDVVLRRERLDRGARADAVAPQRAIFVEARALVPEAEALRHRLLAALEQRRAELLLDRGDRGRAVDLERRRLAGERAHANCVRLRRGLGAALGWSGRPGEGREGGGARGRA